MSATSKSQFNNYSLNGVNPNIAKSYNQPVYKSNRSRQVNVTTGSTGERYFLISFQLIYIYYKFAKVNLKRRIISKL